MNAFKLKYIVGTQPYCIVYVYFNKTLQITISHNIVPNSPFWISALHIFVLEKETDLANPKSIIRALLSYEGTQAEMTQPNTWMEMITETPELWERVVIYGQFQPIDKQENEQQKRNRRNNTFANEISEEYYARQYLNRSRLLQKIRHEIAE